MPTSPLFGQIAYLDAWLGPRRHPHFMARVAALVQDLMLASRVRTSLEASGHEVEQDSSLPDELDGIDLVVADLDAVRSRALG